MENLMALFITLVVIMFILVFLVVGLITGLLIWRDRKTIQQLELEKLKIVSKTKEDEAIRSTNIYKGALENIKKIQKAVRKCYHQLYQQDTFKQPPQISTQVETILEQKNILYYQQISQVVTK